jgi:hypothetical protein
MTVLLPIHFLINIINCNYSIVNYFKLYRRAVFISADNENI